MALIKCPECGKEISDLASQCPHCGCPASEWQNIENKEDVILEVPAETTNKTTDFSKIPHNNGVETVAKIVCAIFAIAAIIAVIQINKKPKPKPNKETTEQIQANRVQDSIRRVEAERLMQERLHKQHVQDSIQAAEKQKAIKRLKPLFREKKDEFNECVWVTPSTAPRYRNYNATYCYFCKAGTSVYNFRFVFQYTADNWLFIDNLIFNIDGRNWTITPNHWEHDNNTTIWEWCDESVSSKSTTGINESFIQALTNAKTVKIRMNGSQYYQTRTMTSAQIKSIKDTYEYYQTLGGTFR